MHAAATALLAIALASPAAAARRDHWAFVAPVRPDPPPVERAGWARNAIDLFVLERLEREGLEPSPEADRITLLRRLSLDLTGLPPSIAEVDAFLAGEGASAGSYEAQVERLLASPHHGERWGRLWLDAARYADSDGFEKDKPRPVWPYRDWVVAATNRDLPYDRFVIEQLAGDQLPGAGQDQVVATGFLRNSMLNEEGGVDPEQFRMEALFDRMDAIGKSVLGLTIQCGQCHSHKYDPLTQEEYYGLFAFLNNDHEACVAVYAPEEAMRRAEVLNPGANLLGPKFKFARHGRCGAELSELLPCLAQVAGDIAIVKGMVTDAFNHAPAQIFMNTGSTQFGRPSMGSWVTYGLGSESRDLPGFVVLSSGKKGPSGGNSNFGSGFLPTVYQGVPFRSAGDPVLYLSSPPGIDAATQHDSIDAIQRLNRVRLGVVGDPEIATRINSFEMAYRMQSSAPELMDIGMEPREVLEMYGAEPGKASFANNCLLARRLVERGVRFVQLFHEAWDQHGNLVAELKQNCRDTDRASAALVRDLKRRGLLDDTIVLWGGEFGRTPMVQGGNDGRDHHPNAFTMWLSGGGIRPGITLGETDELGFNVVRDRVHVHDLHATLLHLLGFDHRRLTFRSQGRDFRLTDVHGSLVEKLLA